MASRARTRLANRVFLEQKPSLSAAVHSTQVGLSIVFGQIYNTEYEDDRSEPIFLTPWTDAGLLRSYKYQKLKRGEDPIQRALEQHSLTKDGLAYNND